MKWRPFIAVGLALTLAAGAACSSTPSEQADKLEKVVLVDGFGGKGRDAWAYVAWKKGWFEEENIQVQIEPGQGTGDNLKALISGRAQLAALDGTGGILTAGATGDHPYKMVALLHQRTLASIITLDPTIAQFSDLEGRTLGVNAAGVNEKLFPALAAKARLDIAKVKVVKFDADNLVGALLGRKVDALSTFLVQQPLIEAKAKEQKWPGMLEHANVLPYADLMTDPIGTALFASDRALADNPDLVKRFRTAVLKGLRYCTQEEHFTECAEIVNEAKPGTSVEAALGEIRTAAPYVTPLSGEIGSLDRSRINKIIALLKQERLMPHDVIPEDVADPTLVPAF